MLIVLYKKYCVVSLNEINQVKCFQQINDFLFKLLTGFERSAVREGISGHVPWARADGCQTAEIAFSVGSTGVDARVNAGVVDAGRFVAGALPIRCTFSGADPVGITVVTLVAIKF